MRIFVTGGTGYVGQVITRHLLANGHEVTLFIRPHGVRIPGPALHQAQVVEGDLFDIHSLTRAMKRHDAVVHLVGIIREQPRRGITMSRVHEEGTFAVLQAAAQASVPRLLHMSALGARPNAVSSYHKSKWKAEEFVRRSGLAYTIFRPSVVFGPGGPGPNFVAQLTDLVRKAPIVPVIGSGDTPLQPVSVETVAEAFCSALTKESAVGQTYELGGPAVVTYAEMLRMIAAACRKPFRPVHIPLPCMRLLALAFQRLPQFPITVDQLQMLAEGNVCSDAARAYADLQLRPIPFTVADST
ncbi:complex I NDUFA9 subunit family protein [Alicyclobacillus cycloheptanicus]|uniref:NADH dehydrogenase n=1 Tax=Alicyclobacillus cycloheptanicus TaxID=1457 RepID=A0ABT9XE64_9BACL|nr:complex I NDUFA9 subunit family protein [Alicyclobacillus cycloheptanicus]MDQ0188586.1 NADH dehydrogenase [Alicyclobacillus cycloheptanicus]WDM01267.1 complex I NDUFA9 subunit family protein [Alicyclobacillus cycloheptanicus]